MARFSRKSAIVYDPDCYTEIFMYMKTNLKQITIILMQSLDFYWQSIVSVELSRVTRMRCIWRIKWNHSICFTLCSKARSIFRKYQICSDRRWVRRVGSAVENFNITNVEMKYLLRYISGMILKFVKTSAMQIISGRK